MSGEVARTMGESKGSEINEHGICKQDLPKMREPKLYVFAR